MNDALAVGGSMDWPQLALFWGTHLVLFVFLAAASWIDLRERVIPDWITVPGVVLGLVAVWLAPSILLPVTHHEPRSFAPPLPVPDVLGAFGGLWSQPGPAWLGAAPYPMGLALALGIALGWWLFCTVSFLEPGHGVVSILREPRHLLLIAGVIGITAAWVVGGVRFAALQSALVGLAVSAGLVWATREGASRALGREAMGFGDVTLMAMIGTWLGWQASILVFFMATFIGLAHGLIGLVLHRDNELPYGPSLCLAAALVVMAWRPLWDRVGSFFAQPLDLAIMLVGVVVLTGVALAIWRRIRG